MRISFPLNARRLRECKPDFLTLVRRVAHGEHIDEAEISAACSRSGVPTELFHQLVGKVHQLTEFEQSGGIAGAQQRLEEAGMARRQAAKALHQAEMAEQRAGAEQAEASALEVERQAIVKHAPALFEAAAGLTTESASALKG